MTDNQNPQTPAYAAPQQAQQQQVFNAPNAQALQQAPTSGLTIAGFVLAFVMPVIGLILSIIAMRNIKKNNEAGSGLALAGIIVSAIFTFFLILYIVFIVIVLIAAAASGDYNTYSSY